MSYLLFMDESGHDRRESPYEVLAGVAIEDAKLWPLIREIQRAEEQFFGRRLSAGGLELKGKKLLKRKTFRQSERLASMADDRRLASARRCLEKGDASRGGQAGNNVTLEELTALAQAKLAFVEYILELCTVHGVIAFASIVEIDAPRPAGDFLRKDYAYLFERYFYFLEDKGNQPGLVVFDELEKTQAHLLVGQMSRYFQDTIRGRQRAALVVPEPFFVHSDLTTMIQIADIVAYVIAWAVRIPHMEKLGREEMSALAEQVVQLRYKAVRGKMGKEDFAIWSFAVLDDLRPRNERLNDGQ